MRRQLTHAVPWLRTRRLAVAAVLALLLVLNLWSRGSELGRRRSADSSPVFSRLEAPPGGDVPPPWDSGAIDYDLWRGTNDLDGPPELAEAVGGATGAEGAAPHRSITDIERFGLAETSPGSNIWFASRKNETSFSAEQLAALREVFDWAETPTARCRNLTWLGGRSFGGRVDGDKAACLDPPLTLGEPGCLVYSIGINDEWSFDEAAAALGCEVHSFDPSMAGASEGPVRTGIAFHKVGIGRNNHTNALGWPVLVLDHLMASIGHQRRTIQYLKADAEGGEMDMLVDQLLDEKGMHRKFTLDRVEQLGLEIHFRLLPEREAVFYDEVRRVFRQLRRLGFDLVQSRPNRLVPQRYVFPGVPRPVSLLYEVLLVRRRRAVPEFDANVRYPCGGQLLCDLADGRVDRLLRAFTTRLAAAPPAPA